MTRVTHQTIKISKGRHASPHDGACVMELASMLAGERFSDHPKSACPVISSFLRTYNDSVDDDRRQALYAIASQVVGTRGPKEVARARAEHLGSTLLDLRLRRHPWTRLVPERVRASLSPRLDMVPARTARMIAVNEGRMQLNVRATIDDLLRIGADPPPAVARDRQVQTGREGSDRDSEPERVLGLG
jgi:hypothetical protein